MSLENTIRIDGQRMRARYRLVLFSNHFPDACWIAVSSRAVLSWSSPVTVSRRLPACPVRVFLSGEPGTCR